MSQKENKKIMWKTIFLNYLKFYNVKQEMNLGKVICPSLQASFWLFLNKWLFCMSKILVNEKNTVFHILYLILTILRQFFHIFNFWDSFIILNCILIYKYSNYCSSYCQPYGIYLPFQKQQQCGSKYYKTFIIYKIILIHKQYRCWKNKPYNNYSQSCKCIAYIFVILKFQEKHTEKGHYYDRWQY